jgi:hypothetical protein
VRALCTEDGENPVLQLKRGKVYTFQISVSPLHPFAILDALPGTVTNNNITGAGVYDLRVEVSVPR